jgi:uncharacterized membrane protein YoaK (UPF0700 family)
MSTPPKTLRDSAKERLTDVMPGLYMITATCGLVDAVCFLALGGVFAEMMTGNLLLMALSIGTGSALGQSARYIPAIVAFSLGALIGGRLLHGPQKLQERLGALIGGRLLRGPQKLQERRIGFAVEWVIIVAATALTWGSDPDAHNLAGHVVVAMLALAMGIQNAMVRVHGVPDIATNVMTVIFTSIIADSTPAGGTNRNWRRRLTSVGLFMASAALGGLLLQFGTVWALVLTSVVFSLAMIPLMFGEKPQ